jgi:nucleoside diphosphate kinase/adenylate kinase family enzyme
MAVEYMVVVVDAVGVRDMKVDTNVEILGEEGYLIMNRTKLFVTEEQAAALTTTHSETRNFLGGPVVALLVKRESAYDRFTELRADMENVYGSCDAWSTLRDSKMFFPTKATLQRTLVVLKPGYTSEDYNTVLHAIDANDFILIDKVSQVMTPAMAEAMSNSKEEVDYLTSDVALSMVLEKVGAVDEWSLLMGPADPALAKIIAPRSLRALLGADVSKNAVYGSPSAEQAAADITLRFPGAFPMERTLALIKPDVLQNGYLDAVLAAVTDNGFTVLARDTFHLSSERVEQLFADQAASPSFPEFERSMRSGPCCVMVLGKPGAVSAWAKLVGPASVDDAQATKPQSLRARFATDTVLDGFYASTPATATKDINLYFPQLSVEVVPSLLEVEDMLNDQAAPSAPTAAATAASLNSVLVEGLTQLCRVKPVGMDAVTWLGEWLLANNPRKPAVEEPVDVSPSLSVRESVAASSTDRDQATKIVWAVGAPGSGKDEQCAYIVKQHGFEFIDVESLLAATEASGNEYGELIKECKRAQKAVPTHITTNLIKAAILGCTGSAKFLINSFPSSLDEAFDFEKRVGSVDLLLYFECSEGTRAARVGAAAGSQDKADAFKELIFPVVDHYSTFSKISKISTDGTAQMVTARVQRLFK